MIFCQGRPAEGQRTERSTRLAIYTGANRMTATRMATLDFPINSMRAQGKDRNEALEIASINGELSSLRSISLINAPDRAHTAQPAAASRVLAGQLVNCLRYGAERWMGTT